MSEKLWSLIFPSRDRIRLLTDLLNSIQKTAKDINSVEVLVVIDDDDKVSIKSSSFLMEQFPFVQFHRVERAWNFSTQYYGHLAEKSKGKYIQALNDDCVFCTPEWDLLADRAFGEAEGRFNSRIIYGGCDDGLSEGHRKWASGSSGASDELYGYSCFPTITRAAYLALGYYFHEAFTTWGADIHLYQIFKLNGRAIPLPYKVDHISHHTHKRERDDLNKRVEELSSFTWSFRETEAERLKQILDKEHG